MCSSLFFRHPIPLNSDLSGLSFRINNSKLECSADGGTTWMKVGGNVKCLKYGTISIDGSEPHEKTISVSSLGFTSASDYYVIIIGEVYQNAGYYISATSSSSFIISLTSSSM